MATVEEVVEKVVERVVEKPNPAKPGDKRAVQDPPKAWPPPPDKPIKK